MDGQKAEDASWSYDANGQCGASQAAQFENRPENFSQTLGSQNANRSDFNRTTNGENADEPEDFGWTLNNQNANWSEDFSQSPNAAGPEDFIQILTESADQREELVVTTNYEFDYRCSNRWRGFQEEDEPVNYQCVTNWRFQMLSVSYPFLRRAKIRTYGAELPLTHFLLHLSKHARALEHLDVDRISTKKLVSLDLTFYSLRTLAIDSIEIAQGNQVRFKVDVLKALFMGTNSLRHVRFSKREGIVYLEVDHLPTAEQICPFPKLTTLVCNHTIVDELNLALLRVLTSGCLSKIIELSLNLGHFDTVLDVPSFSRLRAFVALYDKLAIDWRAGLLRPELAIFVDGVRLDLSLQLHEYHFADPLIQCHQINFARNSLALRPVRTVFQVDYMRLNQWVFDLGAHRNQSLPEQAFDLARFFRQYPNIRAISLLRTAGASPDAITFIRFLRHCRSLTNLELHNPGFRPAVYTQLAGVLAVRTLYSLVLEEAEDQPEMMDFSFLTKMQYLQRLDTNMANRSVMVENLARMSIGARFRFQFRHQRLNERPIFCFVRRETTDQWFVNMSVGQGVANALQHRTLSLNELLDYFKNERNAAITRHWPVEAAGKGGA